MPAQSMPHIGRKIERIRTIKGMKQETLAAELGISQGTLSKIEQSETIDEDKLEQIAKALDVTKDFIKEFKEDSAIYNIQNNHDSASNNVNYQFNPVDKIIELYERMLKEKDELIEMYRQQQKAS